ncbi:phosphotransferase [Curtobacterium sp. Csp1]|uniref:phosphotransferase n=1 Tax=unclassified Curtobacterium TaxID=257496 RepID=UPI001598E297|nr:MULTISPECIES: phosphotransferase [unclassified Curtobacterium]QKS12181.1 phosphotransferase [Curtobacterium sp. csp3]QKS19764.1 phosphotransferase [Curtobacterium sp. Csp1]
MAGSQFTLAALATTAVSGLLVTGTRPLGSAASGDFESAVLREADGTLSAIRRPRNQRAEARQSADLVAIRALSAGIRTRLPFAVAEYRGQAPIGSTRAIVTSYVPGTHPALRDLGQRPELAASVGRAVAAVHLLPTSFVTDAGLPSLTPFEVLRSAVSVMDRAVATKLVPAALKERWEGAARDQQLWQFTPTVVHGALGTGVLLVDGDTVTGMLDWGELRLGDPAKDLAWVLAGRADTFDTVLAAYQAAGGGRDRQLAQRARVYHELETAQWLLHGVQAKSTEVVDDAVAMMHRLVDAVQTPSAAPLQSVSPDTMEIGEVEQLLSSTERRHG